MHTIALRNDEPLLLVPPLLLVLLPFPPSWAAAACPLAGGAVRGRCVELLLGTVVRPVGQLVAIWPGSPHL